MTLKQAQEEGYGSISSLRRRIESGKLPAYRTARTLRVKREDLDAMFEPVAVTAEAEMQQLAKEVAATAPKLNAEQREQLAAILRGCE